MYSLFPLDALPPVGSPFCSPAPRSGHQAVIVKGCMYVFGGEFTSPNQERFHHFKVGCCLHAVCDDSWLPFMDAGVDRNSSGAVRNDVPARGLMYG